MAAEVLVRLRLAIGDAPVDVEVRVPVAPTRPRRMLPVFRALAETVVAQAVRDVEARGLEISCKAGCGACCRQLVPISETEARALMDLVTALPEPSRSTVRARFDDARSRLQAGGLLEGLTDLERLGQDDLEPLALRYFALGIPCPFLEDEACSIHPDRPIACREFLVTSPAEHCAAPTPETVAAVPLAARPSDALARIDGSASPRQSWWIPLTLALDWARSHPDDAPARPGTELLDRFLALLSGADPPPAQRVPSKRKRRR